jgi:hypothetical protein
MRYNAVFAIPEVDKDGRRLIKKWFDAGCRLFIGWASIKNTNGANKTQDRQAQLAWRQAVRDIGAQYVDYVLPDWRDLPSRQDLDLMANDPACAGIFFPDEPNQKPDGKTWRFPIPVLQTYVAPIVAHGGFANKLWVVDLAGNNLTAAWGYYTAEDVGELLGKIPQITHVLENWHPRNNNPARYGDDLPGKAVRILGRHTPKGKQKRGAILECAFEQLPNTVGGRGPTAPEMYAQYQGVMAEAVADDIEIIGYFPEAPKPNAGHIFDNTTDEQFAMVTKVFGEFNPTKSPTVPPVVVDPTPRELLSLINANAQQLDQTRLELSASNAQVATLQEQNKELHERINVLENRKYTVVVAP